MQSGHCLKPRRAPLCLSLNSYHRAGGAGNNQRFYQTSRKLYEKVFGVEVEIEADSFRTSYFRLNVLAIVIPDIDSFILSFAVGKIA